MLNTAKQINDQPNQINLSSQILKLIDFIKYSPSGDNCQPWLFEVSNNKLNIYFDPIKAKHEIDYYSYASILALGCLSESIEISASHFKLECSFQYAVDFKNTKHWAEVSFTENNSLQEHELFPYIKERHTNRYKFGTQELSAQQWDEIKQSEARHNSKIYSVSSQKKSKLKDFILKCEEFLWHHHNIVRDTVAWIRFTDQEVSQSKDGMSLANCNLTQKDAPVIKAIGKSSILLKFLWFLGMKWKIYFQSKSILNSCSQYIGFFCKDLSEISLIELGRTAYLTWLKLCKFNYAVQPLTVASLLPYGIKRNPIYPPYKKEFLDLFNQSQNFISSEFKASENEHLVWMFRVGPILNANKDIRTLRKDTQDLLIKS